MFITAWLLNGNAFGLSFFCRTKKICWRSNMSMLKKRLSHQTILKNVLSFSLTVLLLASVLLPAIQPVCSNAAFTAGSYTYVVVDDGVEITGYSGKGERVVIPKSLGGKTVVGLGRYAFENNASITEIVIPNGITRIEEGAFANLTNLTTVVIPNSVLFIIFFTCIWLFSFILLASKGKGFILCLFIVK